MIVKPVLSTEEFERVKRVSVLSLTRAVLIDYDAHFYDTNDVWLKIVYAVLPQVRDVYMYMHPHSLIRTYSRMFIHTLSICFSHTHSRICIYTHTVTLTHAFMCAHSVCSPVFSSLLRGVGGVHVPSVCVCVRMYVCKYKKYTFTHITHTYTLRWILNSYVFAFLFDDKNENGCSCRLCKNRVQIHDVVGEGAFGLVHSCTVKGMCV
jgi:hypothetical protein